MFFAFALIVPYLDAMAICLSHSLTRINVNTSLDIIDGAYKEVPSHFVVSKISNQIDIENLQSGNGSSLMYGYLSNPIEQ